MHKTKLVSILQTFSEKEFSLFEKWMKSPFFNTNENQAALLKFISPYHPEFKSEKLNKAKISALIFPSGEYNDARMRNLISDVQEKAEDFMVWSTFFQDKAAQKQILLEQLNKRKLHNLFESKLKETRKAIDESEMKMYSSALGHFLADQEEFTHHLSENFGQLYKVHKKFDAQKMIRSSTNLYLTQVLYYYHKLLHDQKMFGKKDFPFSNFQKLARELYNETGQENILALIHLKMLGLDSGNSDYFEIKKELKKKEFDAQPLSEQQNIVVMLSNYCTRKYLNGAQDFLNEMLELGEHSLKKKFCFLGNHISHIFFYNHIIFLLENKQIDKAKEFAAEYKDVIQPNLKESTFHFSMANIYLHEKKFTEAFAALRKAENDTPHRTLSIKNFLLKIYFEKKEIERVPFVIDAIRHHLSSESNFADYLIAGERSFLHFFGMLSKIKYHGGKTSQKDMKEIIHEIKKEGPLINREWLLRMADELQRKIKQ